MRIHLRWILVPALLFFVVGCSTPKKGALARDEQCPSCSAKISTDSKPGEIVRCGSCKEEYTRTTCAVFACDEAMVVLPDSVGNCWHCTKLNFFVTCSNCGQVTSSVVNHLKSSCNSCHRSHHNKGVVLRSNRR